VVYVRVRRDVVAGLLDGARSKYPEEFFCLLGGKRGEDWFIVDEIIFIPYRSSPASAVFHLNDVPWMDRVVGSAHSHPMRTHVSAADRRTFPYIGWIHALILPPYSDASCIRFFDAKGRELRWVEV